MKNTFLARGFSSNLNLGIFDWFSATRYFNEDSFTARLRLYQIASFSIFFINSFLNFLSRLNVSYAITSITCILLIFVRHLIDSNKINTAYIFMLVTINLSFICLTCAESLSSGAFLFFFPSIISFAFLTDIADKKNVHLTYSICIGSFLIALFIAPGRIDFGNISFSTFRLNFFLNVITSFFLIVWMTFSLAKENNRKQTTLRNKEIFLDTIFNSSLHAEIIVDMESGLISNYNRYAVSLFSVPTDIDLLNREVADLFFDVRGAESKSFFQLTGGNSAGWEGEVTCIRMNGIKFPGSISAVSFSYHDKKYKKISILDITYNNLILDVLQDAK